MTDAVDASTLHARNHLFSMMAKGIDGDSICADMKSLGWPPNVVMDTVHALLSGAMLGDRLTPTQRAMIILMGRAVEDSKTPGGFRIGGRAASTVDVIRAANVVLANFAMPVINYPGLERAAI